MLALEGQKVIVIDDGQIGSGETSRTTAHLSNEIDDRYVEIARVHGNEGARIDVLDDEHDAARLAGIVVEKVARAPLAHFDTGECLRFPNQTRFHPLT